MSGGGSNKVPQTPDQQEFARIALAMQQDYEDRWAPQLERFIGNTLDDGQMKQQARNDSLNANARAFSDAAQQAGTAVQRRGGQMQNALGSMALDQGRSSGLGLVDTNLATRSTRLGNLGGLMAIGQGEKAQSFGGLADVARISGQQARDDATNSARNRLGLQSAALTGVGLGVDRWYDQQDTRKPGGEV